MKPTGTEGESEANGDGRGGVKPAFFTPKQTALRWNFHPESVRRLLRRGQIESVVIGGRRLIPTEEIERVESEGRICRTIK